MKNYVFLKTKGECKMKSRHGRKRETNTVATVAHYKHCENVQGMLFVVIPNISILFLQEIFISV